MNRFPALLLLATAIFSQAQLTHAARIERGSLILDNIPESAAGLNEKLDAYMGAREARPLGFSPKGELLIATRFGDVDQLHLVERPGGERRQLTFLREPIASAAFSPDLGLGAYVYSMDTGGNEMAQLYYRHVGAGGSKMLTDGKSSNGAALWSNAGREVAYSSAARDGHGTDIDIVQPESGGLPRRVVSGDGAAWYPLDWSPDDRRLLVLKCVSPSEAYLYTIELGSGLQREVDPAAAKIRITGAKFSRDGQGVYLISDRDSDFAQLRYVDLLSGEKTVLSGQLPWDVLELAISRDGHYLAYASNEAGAGKLYLLDLRTHHELAPPILPSAGVVQSLSFDTEGKRLAFGFAAPNQPEDAYVLEVAANRAEPWTHSEVGAIDAAKFIAPRLAQIPTFDRQGGGPRQVPLYIYEPVSPGPHPVLIELHGGAESQFRLRFDAWIQYVVNELGYAVVAANLRGCGGYGKSYRALGSGRLREDATKDLGALLVWLSLQKAYDAKHVVVSGSGYDGYLTLAALINYGDRLRGGVELGGIVDFIDALGNAAPYALNRQRAEYGDERDLDMRAYLRRISALTNADRISRPLLIAQGRHDPQVPVGQADQFVNRLRNRGGEVWYLQAGDEGRGFQKKSNSDQYFRAFAQFLSAQRQ